MRRRGVGRGCLISLCGLVACFLDSRQEQLQQAERQLKGRLGPFGELRLQQQEEGGILIFGARLPLLKGQGQAIVESPLLKAPIYAHPRTPSMPVRRDTRFHDYRDTDFVLVRTRTKAGCKVSPWLASASFCVSDERSPPG